MKLIVFDLDGTLTRGVSWEILTKKLGGNLAKHRGIYMRAHRNEITASVASRIEFNSL